MHVFCGADARAQVGDQHGLMRKWWRVLPLLLFSRARLRPHRASGHLCAWLPTNGRGPNVRFVATAEEDFQDQEDPDLAEQIDCRARLALY